MFNYRHGIVLAYKLYFTIILLFLLLCYSIILLYYSIGVTYGQIKTLKVICLGNILEIGKYL